MPLSFVIPAQAGIHRFLRSLDPRLRGDDEQWERGDDEPTCAGMTSQNDLAVRSKNLVLLNAH